MYILYDYKSLYTLQELIYIETYGVEVGFVLGVNYVDPKRVWTLIDDSDASPLLARLIEQVPQKQYQPPIWVNVESSNIKAIRYDEQNEILDIQFLSSDDIFFRYENFPQCEYEQFVEAGSIGSYYARHIKGQFESEKLTMDGE